MDINELQNSCDVLSDFESQPINWIWIRKYNNYHLSPTNRALKEAEEWTLTFQKGCNLIMGNEQYYQRTKKQLAVDEEKICFPLSDGLIQIKNEQS